MTKHALGLPSGSVRAILALLLISGFIGGCFAELDATILGMISVFAIIVVKDYFDKDKNKQGENSNEKIQ